MDGYNAQRQKHSLILVSEIQETKTTLISYTGIELFSTSDGHESHTMGMNGCLTTQKGLVILEGFEDPEKVTCIINTFLRWLLLLLVRLFLNQAGIGIKAPTLDFLASKCGNTKQILLNHSLSSEKPELQWIDSLSEKQMLSKVNSNAKIPHSDILVLL